MKDSNEFVVDIYGRKLYPLTEQNLHAVQLAREIEKAREKIASKPERRKNNGDVH